MKNNYKYKLIRVGSKYDGGYFVCPNSISNTDNLISIGIETNWEFEKQFVKINPNTNVNCYDGQTSLKLIIKFFIIQILKTLAFDLNFSLLKRSILNFFEFNSLLKNKLNFIKKNIGLKNGLTFNEIISNKKNIFLKIDIEGSEYRILHEILQNKNKITGLVIEFHDYDLNKIKVDNFIKNIGLEHIHTNINEMGGISQENYPLVLEMTFSREPIKQVVNTEN